MIDLYNKCEIMIIDWLIFVALLLAAFVAVDYELHNYIKVAIKWSLRHLLHADRYCP